MANFGGLILTNRGRVAQALAQTGAALEFTRIALGDGPLGNSLIADLNALKHPVMSLAINKLKTMPNGKVAIGGVLSNQGLTTGFYWREIGVFAKDPANPEAEVLYCYANAGNNGENIPPGGGADIIEKNIDVIVIVGNAPNVSATIDESLVYVTHTQFNDLMEYLGYMPIDGGDFTDPPSGQYFDAGTF